MVAYCDVRLAEEGVIGDSVGVHLTSFGIEFQTEEEAKEK